MFQGKIIIMFLTLTLILDPIDIGMIDAIGVNKSFGIKTNIHDSPALEWNQTFGGIEFDRAYALLWTEDNNFILAGYTDSFGMGGVDIWLVKTNTTGVTIWNQTYGGVEHELALALLQTRDSDYAITGLTWSFGEGECDVWLMKTNASGNIGWNQTYGGLGIDTAYSLLQTEDGGFILAGYTDSYSVGSEDMWLVKTDVKGIMQWNQTYGGIGSDRAYALLQIEDGSFILAGYTESYETKDKDMFLVKTNNNGVMQWTQTYGGPNDEQVDALIQTQDGGYALTGFTESYGAGKKDMWFVKTDPMGVMQWNQTYGRSGSEAAHTLLQIEDGGFVLAGYTDSYGAGGQDMWLVKTDPMGMMQWNQTYGGTYNEEAWALLHVEDGGFVLAGSTSSYGAGKVDMWLVKTQGTQKVVIIIPPHVIFGSLLFFGFSGIFGLLVLYQWKRRR